jgi:hypothetical protein
VSSLRSRIGQRVLARLEQGVAKPGQNPPWLIADASTDAKAVKAATAALAALEKNSAPAASGLPF